jgi:hypothetical protein
MRGSIICKLQYTVMQLLKEGLGSALRRNPWDSPKCAHKIVFLPNKLIGLFPPLLQLALARFDDAA